MFGTCIENDAWYFIRIDFDTPNPDLRERRNVKNE